MNVRELLDCADFVLAYYLLFGKQNSTDNRPCVKLNVCS